MEWMKLSITDFSIVSLYMNIIGYLVHSNKLYFPAAEMVDVMLAKDC